MDPMISPLSDRGILGRNPLCACMRVMPNSGRAPYSGGHNLVQFQITSAAEVIRGQVTLRPDPQHTPDEQQCNGKKKN